MARKTNPVIGEITSGMNWNKTAAENEDATQKPFQTWPDNHSDLPAGRVLPHGVGLKEGELKALDQMGETYDIAVNNLIRFAVQRLILDWREGRVDLQLSIRPKNLKRNSGKKNELQMPIE